MTIITRFSRRLVLSLTGAVVALVLTFQPTAVRAAELSLTTMARLAEVVYLIKKGKSVNKVTPKGFVLRKTFNSRTGVYANLFEEKKTGRVVLSFAGTEFSDPRDLLADLGIAKKEVKKFLGYLLDEIVEDANNIPKPVRKAAKKTLRAVMGVNKKVKKKKARKAMEKGPKASTKLNRQVGAALDMLDRLAKVKKRNGLAIKIAEVEVTGHSLGGFFVQVIAVKRKIRRAVAFNPPGADNYLKGAKGPRHLTNHARKGDLVGRLGKHTGNLYLYKNAKFKWKRVKRVYLAQNHGMRDFREDLAKGMKHKKVVRD